MILLEMPIFGPLPPNTSSPQRIELNAEGTYLQGGLTPSLQTIASVLPTQIPLRIMIRPRGAPLSSLPSMLPDFIYDDLEFEEGMFRAILDLKASDMLDASRGDGFVFGILKQIDHERLGTTLVVDVDRCGLLVEAARPFKCVFHRAFDAALAFQSWEEALGDVVGCGFDGILTSGGPGRAVDHLDVLENIVNAAKGRVEIIVGGGVRSGNIRDILARLGPSARSGPDVWVHSSCLVGDGQESANEAEVTALTLLLR